MTERKLATIQRVKQLIEIPGADKIEIALINGWQVVTQKGQHKEGDLVVFYEIDSFLPASDPRYASFEERFSNWGEKRGMRLKTVKLRKVLSQGLIMPTRNFQELYGVKLSISTEGFDFSKHNLFYNEGDDVTEELGIEKWEPIEKDVPGRVPGAQGEKRFPSFIPKTDQERIQNYGEMVLRSLDEEFEVTMKKDGSSMTVFVVTPDSVHYESAKALYKKNLTLWQKIKAFFAPKKDSENVYGICSRNVLLPIHGDSNFHKAAKPVLEAMSFTGQIYEHGSYAIQGEVVAPDIQENYEKVNEVEFHIFDIFDIESQKYKTPMQRHISVDMLGLNHVTTLATDSLRNLIGLPAENVTADDVVKAALTYASGPGDNKGVMREGLVFKNTQRDFSFKAVSNEYLLLKK